MSKLVSLLHSFAVYYSHPSPGVRRDFQYLPMPPSVKKAYREYCNLIHWTSESKMKEILSTRGFETAIPIDEQVYCFCMTQLPIDRGESVRKTFGRYGFRIDREELECFIRGYTRDRSGEIDYDHPDNYEFCRNRHESEVRVETSKKIIIPFSFNGRNIVKSIIIPFDSTVPSSHNSVVEMY